MAAIAKDLQTFDKLDMPISDWLVYNAINTHLYMSKANPEKKRADDSKVLNWMLRSPAIKDKVLIPELISN